MSVDDSLASLPPTAPGGGEFGAPVTNRTDTVDESNIGGPSRLKLKVRPSPPQYPYADTFFALEVRELERGERGRGIGTAGQDHGSGSSHPAH